LRGEYLLATNETQEYQGQMIGTTVDGVPLRVRVNDQGELVINLEAATVNIGDVDILSIAPGTNVIGKVIPSDADGDEKFTDANPASVKLTGSGVTVGDPLYVSLATKLSAALDSIDVSKMSKGAVTVAHNAITAGATSAEISAVGFNAILVEVGISGAAKKWTFTVQGCMVTGGAFVDMYEMANTGALALMTVVDLTVSRGFVFKGVPDYIKIVAAETEDGATVTVKVQPLNL